MGLLFVPSFPPSTMARSRWWHRGSACLKLGWGVQPGFSARQRKEEVERLNEQLRRINLSLRQQARAGTVYAPGLNYAPLPNFPPATAPSSGGEAVADLASARLGPTSPGLISIDYDAAGGAEAQAGGVCPAWLY